MLRTLIASGLTMLPLTLALSACGVSRAPPPDETDPLVIRTESGLLRGADESGVRVFRGIPYAAAPVGANRWRPPQPAAPWEGTRDALDAGAMCIQGLSALGSVAGSGDEDCLFLNVWSPSPAPANAPVMVWIHGGGYVIGSGIDPPYSGASFAQKHGVVVVTLNYRLGPLGFFAHKLLADEDPSHPTSGNYGIEDQVAALEWVQRNIAAFGGDAHRVTLFGESAGGNSVCIHYTSPRSRGLFHAAIAESGLCTSPMLERPRAEAEMAGDVLAQRVGCVDGDVLACLRAKTAAEVVSRGAVEDLPGGPFFETDTLESNFPTIDGQRITAPALATFTSGQGGTVPLIIGTNRDEGTLFLNPLFATPVKDEADYRAALTRRFDADKVDKIVGQYPVSAYATPSLALAAVAGDVFFVCPTRRAARAAAAAGAPVYMYSFQRELSEPLLPTAGVIHTAELPFVFGNDTGFFLGKIGDAGWPLSDQMEGYWARFAASGDPNDGQAMKWPRYDATADQHLILDVPLATGDGLQRASCDFWDSL